MEIKLGEEQQQAFTAIVKFLKSDEQCFSLTGPAGTGKSLLLSYIIDYLKSKHIHYRLCAPTHKAKTVIEHYTHKSAVTLHKLLSLSPKLNIIELDFKNLFFNMGEPSGEIPYKGVVICDEASMISDDLFELLLKVCTDYESKIIFVSDDKQLMPVKSERVSKVYSVKSHFNLTKIYRQDEKNALRPILQTLREHFIDKFDNCIGEAGSLVCESNFAEFFNLAKQDIEKAIKNSDIFATKVLAYTNARVDKYNEYLTRAIFGDIDTYHKNEILTCAENLSYNGHQYWNSSDYTIYGEPQKIDIHIPMFGKLPGYNLLLYDVGSKSVNDIDILDRTIDSDTLNKLASLIEVTRLSAVKSKKNRSLWRDYYKIIDSFTSPVDLYYKNRVIRKKSFDRGYAITVHRSQGSSFDNVFVDMSNINTCRDINCLRQLQYVALSRTRNNAYIFQK